MSRYAVESWRLVKRTRWVGTMGFGLLVIHTVTFISKRGLSEWIETSGLVAGLACVLVAVLDRLETISIQVQEWNARVDTILTDPDIPDDGPSFSVAEVKTIRRKLFGHPG